MKNEDYWDLLVSRYNIFPKEIKVDFGLGATFNTKTDILPWLDCVDVVDFEDQRWRKFGMSDEQILALEKMGDEILAHFKTTGLDIYDPDVDPKLVPGELVELVNHYNNLFYKYGGKGPMDEYEEYLEKNVNLKQNY